MMESIISSLTPLVPATFAEGKLKLLGSGHCLPGQPISNHELLSYLSASIGKISARRAKMLASRLGIKSRYLSRDFNGRYSKATPSSPHLGQHAINLALQNAELSLPSSHYQPLGYLIGHTTSPHTLLPPNIAWVAEQLNHHEPYMELRQACTGFANALQIASAMLNTSQATKPIAIMGSEVGSVYFDLHKAFIDLQQLVNFVQMGDGAGAVIVASDDNSERSIISDIYIGHIGNGRAPGFHLPQGGSGHVHCEKSLPYFEHNVEEIKQRGGDLFFLGLKAILSRGYHLDDFRYILPHQVNGHIGTLLSKELNIDIDRIIVDADTLGNMGSAAIWTSLDRLRRSNRLVKGDKVLVLGAEATKYLYGGFIYKH